VSDTRSSRAAIAARVGLVLLVVSALLFAAACLFEARTEGSWGSVFLDRGRLNVYAGRPYPKSGGVYRSFVRWDPTRPDFLIDYHSYPSLPARGAEPARASWWFVRAPLWIPIAALGIPISIFYIARWRHRPPWACRDCGYDLRGSRGDECPECGRQRHDITGD
jgi:hypothetical protein